MTMAAAETLMDVLERENAALAAMDLRAAGRLEAEKAAAVAGFADAMRGHGLAPAQAAAQRLDALARANRLLLERAMAAQRTVIATVVDAARQAQPPLRYGASGAAVARRGAMALSARA